MGHGLRLGKIGGVEVVLDWSLLIIFVLITAGLGSGLFARWHSDWGQPLIWGTAIFAAVSFIAAILIHELSHAWVGRARGIEIRKITLFVFGGLAQMEGEPRRWQDEFWMAVVGPFTSALIGFVCIVLGMQFAGDVDLRSADIEASMRELGPAASLLFWLGPVNIVLALFNLVPGFPLDGGRVLRAGLWGLFGDLRRATLWASNAGRVFAGVLIMSGFAMIFGFAIPIFGTGLVNGLWIVLIGWFLHNAAIGSYQQLAIRETLENVTVRQIMQANVAQIDADASVGDFVAGELMNSDQHTFPVVAAGRFLGLVELERIRSVPQAQWHSTRIESLMTPVEELTIVTARDPATKAMTILSRGRPQAIPVVDADDESRVVGLLTHASVLRWLAVFGERSGSDGSRPGI
ncbi:MAG: site-2 protease family protein [Gammaproteobacteria bacterium]|jgi:Zn-dependent protease/CBS domain-containing protein